MSKFSGKCDLFDEIEIFGFDYIKTCDIYVGDSETPLKFSTQDELIQYYPYIITCAFTPKEKRGHIRLSKKSWVDIEEERYGHLAAHDLYREALREELLASVKP